MGVIRKTYNLVMGLLSMVVIGLIAFLFFAAKWQDYKEQQLAEEREELANAVAQEARERGLGDLGQLRQDYLAQCPIGELTILEGEPDSPASPAEQSGRLRSVNSSTPDQ